MDNTAREKSMRVLWDTSHLSGGNAAYLEALYERYLADPNAVDVPWRKYFASLPCVNGAEKEDVHSLIRASMRNLVRKHHGHTPAAVFPVESLEIIKKQIRVLQLINAYRFRGHQQADINPLGNKNATQVADLLLEHHRLSDADLDTVFDTGSLVGPARTTLREIIARLKKTYCNNIGVEYMHITDTVEKRWIQNRIERDGSGPEFSDEVRRRLLDRISAAEGLETYLHTRYVGQKRFSLEGAEAMIPLLDELIQRAGITGLKEIVIGMAHRGRLNMLVNILGKLPTELFSEFEGKEQSNGNGSGDVKYHKGFSSDIDTPGGPVHVALAFNPSHLEIVGPVVEGSVRARQDRRGDKEGEVVMSVLIHGDAAFSGQGVVMETLNMSQSRGFSTKGTVHIVINNQIGFTTSNQKDARSTLYCTDAAKLVNAPIFHVNGDDPESVLLVTQVAFDYRMKFKKDVVIDLVCYRRHGHSEADEPFVTQPMMYKNITEMLTTRVLYEEKLIQSGVVTAETVETHSDLYRQALDAGHCVAPNITNGETDHYPYAVDWRPYLGKMCSALIDSNVPQDTIQKLSERLTTMPEGLALHPSVKRLINDRKKMAEGTLPIDWGFAETMAYATLLSEGHNVRISGQDVGRGTFFHRHVVILNQNDGSTHVPLRNLVEGQGNFLVINSLLSEEAVLAFEYGYSTTDPNTLTLWEAQFGDFANNAQVVIDQFISAGEQKWNRLCGLVLYLPHGYEGQGPEHSSGRLERYLQLCAEHNMQVCVPTSAAQIFHLLRRQMLLVCRKPLVIMTPKRLLRFKLAASPLSDLSEGEFREVIPETEELNDQQVKRVILCSGKVYYDLVERRVQLQRNDTAIIRIEQLYPFPKAHLVKELHRYSNADEFVWCQEEPKNQGAWFPSQHHMRALIEPEHTLYYAGRPMSAAPAVGNMSLHKKQLNAFLEQAFGKAEK